MLNVDPPSHTGYIPAAYRPLKYLSLTFNRSLNDLITSDYRSTFLITSPYRPVAVFSLGPFRNNEIIDNLQYFVFLPATKPENQRLQRFTGYREGVGGAHDNIEIFPDTIYNTRTLAPIDFKVYMR